MRVENVTMFEERAAFFDALEALLLLVRSSAVADAWRERSRVQGFTVGGTCGHTVHTLARLEELLIEVLPADPHIVPIAHFYGSPTSLGSALDDPVNRYVVTDGEDRAMAGPGSVIRALVRFLGELRLDLQDLGPETVVSAAHAPGCAARLDDVIATRVVELVLHADDIACSVGVEWDPPPTAPRVALHALIEVARGRSGDLAVLRALGRLERAEPGTFPVL